MRMASLTWRRGTHHQLTRSSYVYKHFSTLHTITNLFDKDTSIVQINKDDEQISLHLDQVPNNNSSTFFRTENTVSSNWSINNNPNGGYTMAMCISAARDIQKFRDNLTCTCHYTSSLNENVPAVFAATLLKQGSQFSTVTVAVYQEGKQKVQFVGTFGEFDKMKGVTCSENSSNRTRGEKPIDRMDTFEECNDALWNGLNKLNVGTLYSQGVKVYVPDSSPFLETLMKGKDTGEPRIDAWVEFLDGRKPCLRSLALFNDCLPPAVLNYAGISSWVPTIEYTVHSYRRPVSGPMKLSFRADIIHNGVATINGEVKDSENHLCSVSRQMCTIRN